MPENYEVKITRQALEQMKEIVHYISHELLAPEATSNLLTNMELTINSLSEMPGRITLIDEEPWHSEGIRKTAVKNYLIYFWIDEENKKVQVTAVIYEKRDQIKQLLKMDFN
ncbi:MAG: type II toxin-antitoxin system RelE/ParE family toxin [Velocimicrobium sp.]